MQRKLTVIFSADVVGYSGLMERDEGGTLERLKENRKSLFDPRVSAHGGRIFKLMGDGVLIEFSSAASAVTCALEIQQAMAAAESHLPDAERLRYRVGINLGDVIIEGDDIYGEGVNVATRLQALAPIGGIALSRNVSDQVSGKVPGAFEDLGLHTVKNIERPVHVFTVRPAAAHAPAAALTETKQRLAICVLPFANMSGDPEQEYFSDGISEDIITDLSKVSALYVAARNTAFMFKGKHVDVPQVARQLKVSHVLEGSVRKSGKRVRITAQLIDGATGGHIWAERYDRDLNDIFALQDEISQAIVAALKLKLLPEEKKAIEQHGTTNAEAYKLYLMARQYHVAGNLGSARRSEATIRLCRRATEIDPNYARAWALLGLAQGSMLLHVPKDGAGDDGAAATERALALDDTLAVAHAAKASVLRRAGHNDQALREAEVALRLDPESYEANQAAATCYLLLRRMEDAIRHYEKAAALMEGDYASAGHVVSCYEAIGDREGARRAAKLALSSCEKIVAVEPDNGGAMSYGVAALAALGETDRAKEWAERAVLLDPDNTTMRYNLACAFVIHSKDYDAALDLMAPLFEIATRTTMNWYAADPDMDAIRDHPRYKAMVVAAEARLAQSN